MSTHHPTYPALNDTGVKWLGSIPTHWKVQRLKHIASVRASNVDKKTVPGQPQVKLCNYVDVYYHDQITGTLDFMVATALEEQVRKFRLAPGDVVVTKDSEDWNDIAVPALVTEDVPALVCGYHLAMIRPRADRILGRYLSRSFAARGINDQFRVEANGITRFGLGTDALKNGFFPVPPLDEQVAISDFLDRQTGKIDALIAKKKRLIELLLEKRRALISHAVTHGLNANSPKMRTGIPWIGQIPTHWQLKKIGFFAIVGNGSTPERGNEDFWSGGSYPWLNSSVVNDGNVTASPDFVTSVALRECHLPIVPSGSVLIAITGEGKTRGMAAVLRFEATINQHLAFITPNPRLANGDFLRLALASKYDVLRFFSEGGGSTKGALTCEQLKQFKVPLPPLSEQQAIVEYLDRQTAKLDDLMAKVRTAMQRLQEYRIAIIAAAVTGQIDLRKGQGRPAHAAIKIPPMSFRRAVFAAEIIEKCHAQPTFGHVKFQKILHLAEYHLRLQNFDSNYYRQAAGPYDNQMLRSVDRQLETSKWFRPIRTGHAVTYTPMEKAGAHKKYFDNYWSEHREGLERLITLFSKFNTEQCEIVSTLYAVWNDFLLAGASFDDEAIVNDAIAWHPEKQRIERDRWFKALTWMREQGLVPRGTGKPIKVKK